MPPKEKILVTGASGFIGKHFVNTFAQSYDMKVVSLKTAPPSAVPLNDVQAIVHFAGLAHQMQGAPPSEYFRINFELTRDLAKKAKSNGVKQFIYISTAHVFGEFGNLTDHSQRLFESTPCVPKDPYGQSKLAAEEYLKELEDENFVVSIVRPPMVYGEGAKGNLISLGKLIRLFPILPFRFNENHRSVVYVGNLIQFVNLAIQSKKSGIFLPQDEKTVSIEDLVIYIAKAMNKKIILFSIPNFLYSLLKKLKPHLCTRLFGTLAFDSTESNIRLGFVPQVSTEEGIRRMFQVN
jgi:nucleoside-diphosphate-sugar epimerase